jgi:LmbE family N-acetylglucosaminyl deacetylase
MIVYICRYSLEDPILVDEKKSLLMFATYGLEIVECGGTMAKHVLAGWNVHAAVLLARPESRQPILRASATMGVKTRFLDFELGNVSLDKGSKLELIKVIRETRPDIVITQDPEHSFTDLDPDRRQAMILYLEALSLAGRDYALEECGGLEPHPVKSIYYMTPERPNCVVEVSDTFDLKERALAELSYQLEYTASVFKLRLPEAGIRRLLPDYDLLAADGLRLGAALHREMDKGLALAHGMAGHSGAVLGEAYRKEGSFRLEYLTD